MRNPVSSGLFGAFAFFLALAIAMGVFAGRVLSEEINTAPPALEESVCPEGSTMRQDFFDHLLAPGTGWLLHSAHTGDNLVAFWEDMPPPPCCAQGADGRSCHLPVAAAEPGGGRVLPRGWLLDRPFRAGADARAVRDARTHRGIA